MEERINGIKIPNGSYAVRAIYSEQAIPDYHGNPLIEALPPILSFEQAEELLHSYPEYYETERKLDAHYRYHFVQRLFNYFQPWERHFDIEQRISRVIRQGYISRNPLHPNYASDIQKIYMMIKEGNYKFDKCELSPMTASGFTIIGFSGVGKTKAAERVLALYPQIIVHSEYKGEFFSHYQLSWLKLDCPHDGSVKGLCANFFMEIDKLLGENTYNKFASGRNTTTETMIPRMAETARAHSLGVLVIDEIQHLSVAKSGGSEKMLNFFVTLVNKIGVPVILIGTTKAMSVLQSEFRQARRGSGQQGDMIWENMKKDERWELLIEGLWEYQWTKKSTPLTQDIKDVMYEESQGIVDIAVKLYAMSQMRAIATGVETITPNIIRKVAKDNLQLVRPMLQALKSGNKKQIEKYEDIIPIDMDAFKEGHLKILELNEVIKQKKHKAKENNTRVIEESVLELVDYDIELNVAKKVVQQIVDRTGNNIDIKIVVREALKTILQEENSKENQPKKKLSNIKKAEEPYDLRIIVELGRKQNKSVYDSFLFKGLIKNPVEEFIAIG